VTDKTLRHLRAQLIKLADAVMVEIERINKPPRDNVYDAIYFKARTAQRRAEGRCTACGRPRDARGCPVRCGTRKGLALRIAQWKLRKEVPHAAERTAR
jgi:hypothetical protein